LTAPTSHGRAAACLLILVALLACAPAAGARVHRRSTHVGHRISARWHGTTTKIPSLQTPDRASAPSKRPPNPKPPADQSLHVGVAVDSQGWGDSAGDRQAQAVATGAKWVRELFSWQIVQPAPGTWDWSRTDRLMTNASQRGLSVLGLVQEVPSWAGSDWNDIYANPQGYANFVAQVAARYGPGGAFWRSHPELTADPVTYLELLNEPFYSYFSLGGVNPGKYAALVKQSVVAGRAANSGVKYLIAGDSVGSDWPVGFLQGMYDAMPDLNSYFDAVAVHPYSQERSPSLTGDQYGFQHLTATRSLLVAHGASDKPLWITELGWSTCGAGLSKHCVTEGQQATYLQTAFELAKTTYKSFVRGLFVYHYSDFSPYDPSNSEDFYGLTRADGSHKPAYDVVRAEAAGTS
jgi:hypothetical protein